MKLHSDGLDYLFGKDSIGDTIEERAKTSSKMFVYGKYQLAHDSPAATGIKITALEALEKFGEDKLIEICSYGSAIIVNPEEIDIDKLNKTLEEKRLKNE